MTQRVRILLFVYETPGKSATQIAKALGLKRDSVSSVLTKASKDDGFIERVADTGPRGGWTYHPKHAVTSEAFQKYLSSQARPLPPTAWEHILKSEA